jgi:chemotaxis response regulator CheB
MRVQVIDSGNVDSFLICTLLRSSGYELKLSGQDSLDVFTTFMEFQPDAIVMDGDDYGEQKIKDLLVSVVGLRKFPLMVCTNRLMMKGKSYGERVTLEYLDKLYLPSLPWRLRQMV